jgi:tellurite methyltransferase
MSAADRTTWDERWSDPERGRPEPSALVTSLDDLLPARGRALDLAGGAGRHAVWLAQRGLDVTCADVSPVGLERARAAASAAGVSITTRVLDVDDLVAGGSIGEFDLVVIFHFLERRLFPRLRELLAPRGLVVFVQPTTTNLERHAHPSARFCLQPGEARSLAEASGLELVRLDEGWSAEGRHEALLLLRAA